MKSISWFGSVILLMAIVGLAIPIFTTSHTEDVAKIGNIKVQTTEQAVHTVPRVLSAGLLVLGVLLIGAGFYPRGARA